MSQSDGASRAKLLRIVEMAMNAWPPEREGLSRKSDDLVHPTWHATGGEL